MRVLQLGPYPPPHGGVQTNLVAIHRHLQRRGIPALVVNITRHRKAPTSDVRYPRNAAELLGLLLKLPYDVVHLHVGGHLSARLVALALVCCLVPGARAILTFHSGGYARSRAARGARPASLRGFVLRRFDRLIGVNREIVELFHRFGVPAGRTRLIPPYAPAVSDGPAAGPPASVRAFLAAHRPRLLTVGLLEPEYDLPLQIEALGALRRRLPGAGLVIAGAGSLEGALRALVARSPHGSHVLLCGDLDHEAVLGLMRECDLFLRTTRYDGDAVSVREALDAGLPVVATDNGMRPPGVDLIPVGDAAALVEAVARGLERGRGEPVVPEPDDRNLEAVVDVYREALAGRSAWTRERGGAGRVRP